ncbi:MAG: glycoside hydrolase family 13 [Verrucomicrobia bacterium]|nr:glycoside hydrolase family 13 [Verrucomicrobiota bacterium]
MKSQKVSSRSPKATRSLAKTSTPASTPAPVALKLRAPAAKEVFVAGSFNGWQVGVTPLRPAQGGEWQGELKLTPGRYEYLFVVDGTWLADPTAPEAAPNPFGGWNSVLSVN